MRTIRQLTIALVGCLLITLVLSEPTLAEQPGETASDIDWRDLIVSLAEFVAEVFIVAAENLQEGVDMLSEWLED